MTKKSDKDEKPPLPADGSTITTRVEQKQVEQRIAIGAHVVYETIRREGEDELHRPGAALAWSALAAGLCMGFSFIAEALLMSHLPDAPWRPLISRLGYCVGFLIVILGRQQLFTENTLNRHPALAPAQGPDHLFSRCAFVGYRADREFRRHLLIRSDHRPCGAVPSTSS